MLRPLLSQHDCLALFDRDRSTWGAGHPKKYPQPGEAGGAVSTCHGGAPQRRNDCDGNFLGNIRFFPSTVTCRRMLRFADWAARFPKNYCAARRAYEAPELSFRELAFMAGMPESTFRSRLKPVYCCDDPEDFSDLELDCYDVEIPQLPCRTRRTGQTSLTYKYAIALADFAAADQIRWECIRLYYTGGFTQDQISKVCRISQATVSRYLETLSTIKGGINYEYL